MQTDVGSAGLGQNFSVAALQRQVGKSSNLGIIGVNRSSVEKGDFVKSAFNRLLGVDYNFATADRNHRGKVFFHKSFSFDKPEDSYAHAS